jgi:LPPG:FO 2-phospho-L-lactate transferase
MSDDPVRTRVLAGGAWHGLQEFLIQRRGEGPVEGVELAGAAAARPAPEVLDAMAEARAIVVGPSNPVISIGPILAVPGVREAMAAARAPVVGVSPIVRGEVVKGPTAAFLAWAGMPATDAGVRAHYGALLDALVGDTDDADLVLDTRMDDPAARARVAEAVLRFATSLG